MKTRSIHICRGWLIAGPLLLAWWSVDAADGKLEVGQPKIYRAQGEYVRYELVLDKALPNGEAMRLFIHGDTTGAAAGGWGLMAWPDDAATNRPQGIVLEGFRREGDRLLGRISGDYYCRPEFRVDVQAQVFGGKIEGAYQGYTKDNRSVGGRRPVQSDVKGTLTGRVVTQQELREANGIASVHNWPWHRGQFSNGSAPDCGRPLVERFADARLLWLSEEGFTGAYRSYTFGGYGGPVVADGKVFVYYSRSCDKIIAPDRPVPKGDASPEHLRWRSALDGEERVVCVDAATGRTLWRASWPGMNYTIWDKGGHHTMPCVADGKVLVQSGMFTVYALDADSGALLWSWADSAVAQSQLRRCAALAAGQMPDIEDKQRWNNTPPMVADGVLMISGNEGPAGLAVADGRVLWDKAKRIFVPDGMPLRWVHRGKEYFVVGGHTAVEPRTGRVLWRIPGAAAPYAAALTEDYLITGQPLSCYRITPSEASLLWRLPEDHNLYTGHASPTCPMVYDGHVYAYLQLERGMSTKKLAMVAVDLATGEVRGRIDGDCGMFFSPMATSGRIISHDGIQLLKTAPGFMRFAPAPASRERTIMALGAAAAVADGRYFARVGWGCTGMVCYDLRTTEESLQRRSQERADLTAKLLEVLRTKGRTEWESCVDTLRRPEFNGPELNALKRAVQVLTARAQNQQDQDNRYGAALRLAALATTELQAAEVKVIREVAVPVLREMATFNQQAAEARRALEELGAESSGRSRPAVEGGDSLESEGGH